MPNIPKPELERGNYICYAYEPNTIVDNSGGGGDEGGGDEGGGDEGGGVAFDEYQIAVQLYCGAESSFEDIEPFKDVCILYNGEPLTGFTMNTDVGAFEKILTVKALDVITGLPNGVPGLGPVELSEGDYNWCLKFAPAELGVGKPVVMLASKSWVNSFTIESDIPWVSFLVDKAVL